MYSTCMFCHTGLGANESIEHFPVGRRLAYDAAKGRLWAVCRACERWNLSPLDERWEAIEECERLFRDTKLRVSTDNIGLARLKEGTTLVRVGEPQRPEMAAWRYGDQFYRRRKKHYALVAGGAVLIGGVVVAGPVMGLIGGGAINLVNVGAQLYTHSTVARVRVSGQVLKLSRRLLGLVSLKPDYEGGFSIDVPYRNRQAWFSGTAWRNTPRVELKGDDALAAARGLLPMINRAGASSRAVTDAVGVLEKSSGTASLFGETAVSWRSLADKNALQRMWNWNTWETDGQIAQLPAPVRLALEMSLHENDERRALDGELSILEDRWREAEEVAAISDDMFLPAGVGAMLEKLKGR